jgi:exodeoxyribonuclease VII small subunit
MPRATKATNSQPASRQESAETSSARRQSTKGSDHNTRSGSQGTKSRPQAGAAPEGEAAKGFGATPGDMPGDMTGDAAEAMEPHGGTELADSLNYNEARTALDLALAQLQSSDLAVEAMAGLYQRAQAYANRCEAILDAVEHQVLTWDTTDPASKPEPLQP